MKKIVPTALLLLLAGYLVSQPAPRETVGPLRDGGVRLVNGWTLRPAGRQLALDTFPMSSLLSADRKYLLVLHGGYNPPSIAVIDTAAEKEVSRTPVADAWLGMALTSNGQILYVGGGSRGAVYEFRFEDGKLTPTRTFETVPAAERTHRDFIGDVALTPDGRLLYAADLFHDQVLVINPQSGRVIEKFPTGRRPYRILFHPDGRSYFVTSWADGTLYHHEAANGKPFGQVRLGPHTTDMLWLDAPVSAAKEDDEPSYKGRIFVTASNTNRVYAVGVGEDKSLRHIETINVSLTPNQPLGMTPSALAVNPAKDRLFVVCSDANAVAVADISGARTRLLGFVPTGWYPVAARVLPDNRLVVLNGRGPRSYPNPKGPNPAVRPSPVHGGVQAIEYVGRIQKGSASIIDPLTPEALERHTQTVFANSPYEDAQLEGVNIPAGNPVPSRPGAAGPIQHVLYIVKENRTYDQVFGDIGKGNSDPSLCLFPEKISPNHHKLAREYVLFDNFYVNSDVSADGHNWSTAAIAPDYVQKMWPNSYGGRRRHYDYEGGDPAARPPAGYIWTAVRAAGLSMRNYGYFTENIPAAEVKPGGDQVRNIRDPALVPVTHRGYRGFDMDYPDVERAKVFIEDFQRMDREGSVPRFMVLRLGNDHTSGTAAGKISPLAAMADNDLAFGMIVEACSRSKAWARMAIFVLEDDAQNGPDHVDSHRAPAFVLSPYTRRGIIDSTFYNTTSMLRTMELLLGLRPMTHFDASANVMWAAFSARADLTPYTAEKPRHPLDERNPAASPTAARSAAMDFSEADRIDDDELNDILWIALRKEPPPAPVRSYFGR